MKYICSKNYKILCKENCYHVKNIKEENKVWFDTIDEGLKYGCRPCKHCMSDIVVIPSGSVITKEQMDAVYKLAKIPISTEEFKKLGYTDEESKELVKASHIYKSINFPDDIMECLKEAERVIMTPLYLL